MSSDRETTLRKKAVADHDARPWRYYQLDRDTLMKMLEQLADRLLIASTPPASAPAEPCHEVNIEHQQAGHVVSRAVEYSCSCGKSWGTVPRPIPPLSRSEDT
jgi:hypothetical protein